MKPQLASRVKPSDTVRTVMWPYVAVNATFVSHQLVRVVERLVARRTRVGFLPRVDPYVTLQIRRLTKRPVTHVTLERLLPAVSSPVRNKISGLRKPLAANPTLKWFLPGMKSPVQRQRLTG